MKTALNFSAATGVDLSQRPSELNQTGAVAFLFTDNKIVERC